MSVSIFLFVVTDNSDTNSTLIFCIEYVITQEITIWKFTAIKIKYCVSTAFHGIAVNMLIINWTL